MTAKDKQSDINVGEEAIRRLAGQVFDAPKDRLKAKETVSGNKGGNGRGCDNSKTYQEQHEQYNKDVEKQKEKKPFVS